MSRKRKVKCPKCGKLVYEDEILATDVGEICSNCYTALLARDVVIDALKGEDRILRSGEAEAICRHVFLLISDHSWLQPLYRIIDFIVMKYYQGENVKISELTRMWKRKFERTGRSPRFRLDSAIMLLENLGIVERSTEAGPDNESSVEVLNPTPQLIRFLESGIDMGPIAILALSIFERRYFDIRPLRWAIETVQDVVIDEEGNEIDRFALYEPRYECTICGDVFRTREEISHHIKESHEIHISINDYIIERKGKKKGYLIPISHFYFKGRRLGLSPEDVNKILSRKICALKALVPPGIKKGKDALIKNKDTISLLVDPLWIKYCARIKSRGLERERARW